MADHDPSQEPGRNAAEQGHEAAAASSSHQSSSSQASTRTAAGQGSSNSGGSIRVDFTAETGELRRRRVTVPTMPQQQASHREANAAAASVPQAATNRVNVQPRTGTITPGATIRVLPGNQVQIVTNGGQPQPQAGANRLTAVNTAGRRVVVRSASTPASPQVRIVANGGAPPQRSHVARIQVPPLQPQPLPYSGESNTTDSAQPDRNKFKCLICFEFLEIPASCGKCNARFCFRCITRVAQMSQSPKCPTCRCDFTREDITRDQDLAQQMGKSQLVPCHYEGCSAVLAMGDVADHEQVCPFVPLKCRYATFGCEWKGLRKDLANHEQACPLEQVSSLVQQFRQTRADHEHALAHLQTRVAASNAMMELHASLIRRLHKRLYHPGDFCDLIFTVVCTPARFLFTKDLWRALVNCRLARGTVSNVLALLPFLVIMLREAIVGIRKLLDIDAAATAPQWTVVLVNLLIWLLLFPPLIAKFAIFGQNSLEWKTFRGSDAVLKYTCTVFCCALLPLDVGFLLEEQSNVGYVLQWALALTCTTFFTSLVVTTIESCIGVNQARPTNVWNSGRAFPIFIQTMRNGLVLRLTGLLSSAVSRKYSAFWAVLEATILESMLFRFLPEAPRKILTIPPARVQQLMDCSAQRAIFIVVFCSAIAVKEDGWAYIAFQEIPALLFTLLANVYIHFLIKWSTHVANRLFKEGKDNLLPNQAGVRKEYSTVGVLCFTTWLAFLATLAIMY